MKNKILFFSIIFVITYTKILASTKNDIIQNLRNINNISFKFEQNINGKIETGNCTIQYPKKNFL